MARKILLADDSVTAQNMGRKILADAGYEVITVNNGSAALKKIGETRPDLIVLDVYMPGYSGLEVCQRLKEVADTARIPILLTVGKLEPFKPDEAKRVRADAFIVKPFEASELLSVLSKLEDKVVPRADSSKPGRFARVTAALEEGKYDKVMAVEENDSGWKNRISFPRKKKEKPPEKEKEIDTGEIYNPVNKDLRTIVDHKAEQPAAAHGEEFHVNVGALASEGLPKDVTPEEIAALAAAAAQIKGKVVEEKPAPIPEAMVSAPPQVEATQPESGETTKPASVEPTKVEGKEEPRAIEAAPAPEVAASASTATFAEQAPAPEKSEEKKPGHKSGPAEVMAAIAGLETEWISLPAAGFGNGAWAGREKEAAAEPVTMAVAAHAASSAAAPRWSAVPIALAPEEAAISLEQEMQKASAAFAGAADHAAENEPAEIEKEAAPVASAEPANVEAVPTQATVDILATPVPEPAQSPAAVSERVRELEVVASKYEAEQSSFSPEATHDKDLQATALESSTTPATEAPVSEASATEQQAKVEDRIEDRIVERTAEETIEKKAETGTEPEEAVVKQVEPAIHDIHSAPTMEFAVPVALHRVESRQETEIAHGTLDPQAAEAGSNAEIPEEEAISAPAATEAVPVSGASTARGTDDMATRESETAAAWASWRKIRETGSKSGQVDPSGKELGESIPREEAAMAVAAGAEGKPEEASSSLDSDPEIAGIVDSVLADMRPKIVEEIARKLGKKK